MTSRWKENLANQQLDEIANWINASKLTKWQVDEMGRWQITSVVLSNILSYDVLSENGL